MRYVFRATETTTYRFPTHINELLYGREEAAATEAFIVVLGPGEAPPLHKHPEAEQVFYVIEGSGLLQIAAGQTGIGQQYRLSAGDLVRVPPDTWHSVYNDGSTPLRYLSVDAFVGGKPTDELSWDEHVKAICAMNGWAFEAVKQTKGGDATVA
ncbi:MAG: cupin domain-containing protein [Anaerolineae bacterium]